MISVLALDAMGVLYDHADDVAELLVPYARSIRRDLPREIIEHAYVDCSLGLLSSGDFWRQLGIDPEGRDQDYCSRHRLVPGVAEFLKSAQGSVAHIACLSNDVSEWSKLLRKRFDLGNSIQTWVISGDVGARKPAPEIYEELMRWVGAPAEEILFIDDREKNLEAARMLGMRCVSFGPGTGPGTSRGRPGTLPVRHANSMPALAAFLAEEMSWN